LTGLDDRALAPAGLDESGLAGLSRRLFGAGLEALLGATRRTAGGQVGLGSDPLTRDGAALEDLAPVDPNLDADGANRGPGGGSPEIDVGTQGVQRHSSLAVPLTTAHVGAAETALALDT